MDEKIRQLALESFSLGLKEEFEIYFSGFEAGFKANKKIAETGKACDQVEIDGLLWDTENLNIAGETFFTYDEALKAATSVGKRLPTKEEYQALLELGWRWDSKKKGILVANKLFFPAAGYRNNSSGSLDYSGSNGYVWSSTPYGTSDAYSLTFYASVAYVYNGNRSYGFSVRCVQDAKKK